MKKRGSSEKISKKFSAQLIFACISGNVRYKNFFEEKYKSALADAFNGNIKGIS